MSWRIPVCFLCRRRLGAVPAYFINLIRFPPRAGLLVIGCLRNSAGLRVWPGQAVSFFCIFCWSVRLAGLSSFFLFVFSLVVLSGSRISRPDPGGYTLNQFSRSMRLAWPNCRCFSPSCIGVVVSRRLVCFLTCSWCNAGYCLRQVILSFHRCRKLLTSVECH